MRGEEKDMYGWNVNFAIEPYRATGRATALPARRGLVVGTRVALGQSWRPVETLRVGDKVLTFDNGMQQIADIRRRSVLLDGRDGALSVTIPAGAMGNRDDITLLPDQGVMLESAGASDPMGDPFAVVPAQALVGREGICSGFPGRQVDLITLFFGEEEVIYADGGLTLHCPTDLAAPRDIMPPPERLYEVIALRAGRDLVAAAADLREALLHSADHATDPDERGLVA